MIDELVRHVLAAKFAVIGRRTTWRRAVRPRPGGEARTALIIGNAAYSFAQARESDQRRTRHGRRRCAGAGFEVIFRDRCRPGRHERPIRTFGSALKAKGGVGLLFFSGHGVQVQWRELHPADRQRAVQRGRERGAVTAPRRSTPCRRRATLLNIVVLDACRDNPWPAAARAGLSRIDSSSSLFVSFATSPGETALDGSGRQQPLHQASLRARSTRPTSTIEDTFKRTLKGVYQETGGKQQPWISSSFFGEFVSPGRRAAVSERSRPRDGGTPQMAADAPEPEPVGSSPAVYYASRAPIRTAAAIAAWSL